MTDRPDRQELLDRLSGRHAAPLTAREVAEWETFWAGLLREYERAGNELADTQGIRDGRASAEGATGDA